MIDLDALEQLARNGFEDRVDVLDLIQRLREAENERDLRAMALAQREARIAHLERVREAAREAVKYGTAAYAGKLKWLAPLRAALRAVDSA